MQVKQANLQFKIPLLQSRWRRGNAFPLLCAQLRRGHEHGLSRSERSRSEHTNQRIPPLIWVSNWDRRKHTDPTRSRSRSQHGTPAEQTEFPPEQKTPALESPENQVWEAPPQRHPYKCARWKQFGPSNDRASDSSTTVWRHFSETSRDQGRDLIQPWRLVLNVSKTLLCTWFQKMVSDPLRGTVTDRALFPWGNNGLFLVKVVKS